MRLRLERAGVNPAYSGWLVGGLAGFFFVAATNTLAGWLYLMSGLMAAILLVSIMLVQRSLDGLEVRRSPLSPVHAGDQVSVTLTLHNRRPALSQPVQVLSSWPPSLASPVQITVGSIAAEGDERCTLLTLADRRGIYRWPSAALRTAAPLGLVWYRRVYPLPARLAVYPRVISLSRCPILDNLDRLTSQDHRLLALRQRRTYLDTSGMMRSLRPYRWGDPMRLIHWRSSARYGQLRTREMEESFSQRQVTVALDQTGWQDDRFEQAVTVAASLIRYALDRQIGVQLWTSETGVVAGPTAMMETLAQVSVEGHRDKPRKEAQGRIQGGCIGLTAHPSSLSRQLQSSLPQALILWPARSPTTAAQGGMAPAEDAIPTLQIQPDQPLQPQLQHG